MPLEKQLNAVFKKSYSVFLRALMQSGLKDMEFAAKSTRSNDEIQVRWERVYGLSIPKIQPNFTKRNPLDRGYGMSSTPAAIDETAEYAEEVVSLLVMVSELKNILRTLEREVERTIVRVFALEKVLIPSLEEETKRIEIKLEERERERHIVWELTKNKTEDQENSIKN